MSGFTTGWHVVYTKPRHEKKVANALVSGAIEYYLPTTKVLRTWHDRKKYISVPLFQSYVFVYLSSLKDYHEGLKIDGILNYVKFGKETARVSNEVIENIRAIVSYTDCVDVNTSYYPPGQKLFIQHGPLTGISCEVIASDNKQNVRVMVRLLQRNLLISLPADYFIALPA
jgi:transcriptional antiterminator RfaH